MAAVSAADLAAIAELQAQTSKNLERISKNLHDHIAAEGKRIGDARGVQYAQTAREQIDAHATEFRRMRKALDELADDARWTLSAGTYMIDASSVLRIVTEAIGPDGNQPSATSTTQQKEPQ